MGKVAIKIVGANEGYGGMIDRRTFKPEEVVLWQKGVHHQPLPMTVTEFFGMLGTDSPVAWYRYNSGVTVTGSGVSQWDDASGNGNHLKQGTDTNRPAKQADGSILFDGVDNYLKTDAFTLNQPETVYLLMKQVTWTLNDVLTDGNGTGTGRIWQRGTTPNLGLHAGANAGSVALTLDTYGVIAAVFNGASSLLQVNQGTPSTGDAGAGNMGGFTLGAAADPAAYSNIQCKEAIIFPAAHDAATRSRVISYLMRVGGL